MTSLSHLVAKMRLDHPSPRAHRGRRVRSYFVDPYKPITPKFFGPSSRRQATRYQPPMYNATSSTDCSLVDECISLAIVAQDDVNLDDIDHLAIAIDVHGYSTIANLMVDYLQFPDKPTNFHKVDNTKWRHHLGLFTVSSEFDNSTWCCSCAVCSLYPGFFELPTSKEQLILLKPCVLELSSCFGLVDVID
jgi:hypothetical protein